MDHICIYLDDLITEADASGVDYSRMNGRDLRSLRKVLSGRDEILLLTDESRHQPVFLNEATRCFFGLTNDAAEGIDSERLLRIIHPDDAMNIHRALHFFKRNPNGILRNCFRARKHTGDWRWMYGAKRTLNYHHDGHPNLAVNLYYEIDALLLRSRRRQKDDILQAKRNRYASLTKREKQVLDMIANEMTSHEIARELFIETSTVDTHRKHIIRKLNVKSSLGLVEYSLYFSRRRKKSTQI